MISFFIAIILLIIGYFVYGKITEKRFGPDDRQTPAYAINDGVDYVPMPLWKVYLIQLLNIAGTGPIFGALSGAVFGPVVYIWIVLGCIFAGGVHDYFCGMISIRHKGASVSEITGYYLGNGMKQVMRVFSVILLVMCGVVFTGGPAGLLSLITPKQFNTTFWLLVVAVYYFVATFVPIDKIIGRIYPLFGICLIVMAVGVGGSLVFSDKFQMPEVWSHFTNMHPEKTEVWPFMFITVACGAVSGFHATQSPIMARCCKDERQGRRVFYGAMISEGIIALVWAAAGVSCYDSTRALLDAGAGCSAVVYEVCQSTMGKFGCILAMLGVIACPISSGDTAYRSARLTLADWMKLDQSDWKKRLWLTLPILLIGTALCFVDYSIIWRYFSWANQTLAAIVLWTASVYLYKKGKVSLITLIPAVFMTAVSVTYFMSAPECMGILWKGLRIDHGVYYNLACAVGAVVAIVLMIVYARKVNKYKRIGHIENDEF